MAKTVEGLALLRLRFDQMQRASDNSLRAAYNFGEVVVVLSRTHTYEEMGIEVDRTAGTIAKYATLFNRYNTVDDLLQTAHKYDTFDTSILAGSAENLSAKFGYQCGNCGSWETHRRPKTDAARAQETVDRLVKDRDAKASVS